MPVEAKRVSVGGRHRRENVGMSSESKVRIFAVESLRFPGEGSSAQGKSGPKPRTKVVGDGQQVEIPVPHKRRMKDAVTQKDRRSRVMVNSVQVLRLVCSEERTSKGWGTTGTENK